MTTLQPSPVAHESSDYGSLLAQVRAAGLLDRSLVGYLPRLITLSALVAVGLFLLFSLGNSPWQFALAAYSAVVLTQLGFLGHDAGHQQMSCYRRRNDLFGTVLAAAGVGLSYRWWVDKHARHHRNPNEVGRDPDVQRGVLAWTDGQASRQRGVLRLIAGHQAGLFFPLLTLEGWSLHVASVQSLLTKRGHRSVEAALLAVHVAIGLALLLLVLPPLRAVEFVVIQQAVLGVYMGCSFAPNHKGMPMPDPDSPLDFFRRQVLTSRNVSGGRVLAMIFGSLNYQIEHHLFPSMPSRNLARCRPIVREFCAARSVPYTETALLHSYAQCLRYLGSVTPDGSSTTVTDRKSTLVDRARGLRRTVRS